jgi:hypothetical protein
MRQPLLDYKTAGDTFHLWHVQMKYQGLREVSLFKGVDTTSLKNVLFNHQIPLLATLATYKKGIHLPTLRCYHRFI